MHYIKTHYKITLRYIYLFMFRLRTMIFNYKQTLLFLIFLFSSSLEAGYEAVNAFPNLSFEDPVGIYHAGDDTDRIFVLEQELYTCFFDYIC